MKIQMPSAGDVIVLPRDCTVDVQLTNHTLLGKYMKVAKAGVRKHYYSMYKYNPKTQNYDVIKHEKAGQGWQDKLREKALAEVPENSVKIATAKMREEAPVPESGLTYPVVFPAGTRMMIMSIGSAKVGYPAYVKFKILEVPKGSRIAKCCWESRVSYLDGLEFELETSPHT